MEPNIKPIKIDEIKDENKEIKKKDKTEFIGIYSPNGDNESIYFKFNNISIKNSTSAEIVKITPSHDKEIKEDSIIYFTKKLNKNNIEYHKYLYISIVIFFTDIIIWYFDKQLFHEYFNLYSLLIILGMTIIQIFLFKHNFETITKKVYIFTNRIIYLYIVSIIIYLANLTFITYFGIIYNYGKKNHIFKYPMFNLNFFNFGFISPFITNFSSSGFFTFGIIFFYLIFQIF